LVAEKIRNNVKRSQSASESRAVEMGFKKPKFLRFYKNKTKTTKVRILGFLKFFFTYCVTNSIIMIYKHELGFAAFTWPNRCLLDLSLLFIVLVGRNFVSGICKLKLKTPKINFKNLFFVSKTRIFPALNDSGSWLPQGRLPSLSSAP